MARVFASYARTDNKYVSFVPTYMLLHKCTYSLNVLFFIILIISQQGFSITAAAAGAGAGAAAAIGSCSFCSSFTQFLILFSFCTVV